MIQGKKTDGDREKEREVSEESGRRGETKKARGD